jgi:hypothetical protein
MLMPNTELTVAVVELLASPVILIAPVPEVRMSVPKIDTDESKPPAVPVLP